MTPLTQASHLNGYSMPPQQQQAAQQAAQQAQAQAQQHAFQHVSQQGQQPQGASTQSIQSMFMQSSVPQQINGGVPGYDLMQQQQQQQHQQMQMHMHMQWMQQQQQQQPPPQQQQPQVSSHLHMAPQLQASHLSSSHSPMPHSFTSFPQQHGHGFAPMHGLSNGLSVYPSYGSTPLLNPNGLSLSNAPSGVGVRMSAPLVPSLVGGMPMTHGAMHGMGMGMGSASSAMSGSSSTGLSPLEAYKRKITSGSEGTGIDAQRAAPKGKMADGTDVHSSQGPSPSAQPLGSFVSAPTSPILLQPHSSHSSYPLPPPLSIGSHAQLRRHKHKEVEVRRRRKISTLFVELSELLECGSQMDKASVLNCAAKFIRRAKAAGVKAMGALETGPTASASAASSEPTTSAGAATTVTAATATTDVGTSTPKSHGADPDADEDPEEEEAEGAEEAEASSEQSVAGEKEANKPPQQQRKRKRLEGSGSGSSSSVTSEAASPIRKTAAVASVGSFPAATDQVAPSQATSSVSGAPNQQ